jgi:hypothetical protein
MLPRTVWSFIWQKVTETTIKWLESTQHSMLVKLAPAEEIVPFSKNISSYVTSELCIRKEDATDCFIADLGKLYGK